MGRLFIKGGHFFGFGRGLAGKTQVEGFLLRVKIVDLAGKQTLGPLKRVFGCKILFWEGKSLFLMDFVLIWLIISHFCLIMCC